MTIYEKELAKIIETKFSKLSQSQLIEKFIDMGVIDFSRCKILAVREYVAQMAKTNVKKTDAMWIASEKFGCSYEYIRKCMYYYNDVNIC